MCLDAEYQGTSAAATANMTSLLEQWKAVGPSPNTTVTAPRPAPSSCTPATRGKDVKLTGTDRSSDALEVVAARLELAGIFFKQSIPDSAAKCASTGTIDRLSLDQIVSNDDAAQQADQHAVEQAIAACH